jgi:hypothetical protein
VQDLIGAVIPADLVKSAELVLEENSVNRPIFFWTLFFANSLESDLVV